MIMNKITFENKITKEILICDDIRHVRIFEGIEYISVHRVNETPVSYTHLTLPTTPYV